MPNVVRNYPITRRQVVQYLRNVTRLATKIAAAFEGATDPVGYETRKRALSIIGNAVACRDALDERKGSGRPWRSRMKARAARKAEKGRIPAITNPGKAIGESVEVERAGGWRAATGVLAGLWS